MVSERIGKVVYTDGVGLLYIREEGINGEVRPCTLDKIDNYSGESLRQLKRFSPRGLRVGVLVKFTVDVEKNKIQLVKSLVFRSS